MHKLQPQHHDAEKTPDFRATLRREEPSRWARFCTKVGKFRLPVLSALMAATTLSMALPAPEAQQPVTAATDTAARATPQAPRVLVPVHATRQLDIATPAWSDDARYAEVILNATTGEIVFDRNADDARHVASMAKVMTAYMVFDAISRGQITLDTQLTASEFAVSRECSCYGKREGREMQAGDTMTVREALHALMAGSYNDVATMVAEGISGSEEAFTARMTEMARTLGANTIVFGTASGLEGDDGTALDVALIYNRMSQDYPALYGEFFTPARVVVGGQERDNCRLCEGGRYDANDGEGAVAGMQATGQKTGYRRASGFSMVAEFTRAGERYIIVTMGAGNDRQRHNRTAELAGAVSADSGTTLVAARPAAARRDTII
jgi:D-alanyl-D-alanine carboxypeptidase